MPIDTGTGFILAAGLIFYLRLIIIQRNHARLARQNAQANAVKGKKKNQPQQTVLDPQLSILSKRPVDWIIAGLGIVAILLGILINRHLILAGIPYSAWWILVSAGIVAFSWAFR